MTEPEHNHVEMICRIGQGADCCRYLIATKRGFCCAKKHADAKVVLDQRAALHKIRARADNCDGFPMQVRLA